MDKKFTVKVSTKPQRNTMHFEAQRSGANRAQVFTPKKGKGSYSRKIKHAMGLEQQATAEACFSFASIYTVQNKSSSHSGGFASSVSK